MHDELTIDIEPAPSPLPLSPKRDGAAARWLNKAQLRRSWLAVHRWLGLTVGLLFVFLGLTGSLLVFDHAIDEWLNPELLLTKGTGSRRPLVEVIDQARRAYSGSSRHPTAVSAPRVPNGVWKVWFQSGSEEAPTVTGVYVDPTTAQVRGQRVWGEDLMSIIYKLHYTLLAGKSGETIVGLTGLVLLVSVCSGVYLWWPLWTCGWAAAFAIRRGRRFNYDLHKTLGIVAAPLLAVIAFTGVYLVFPEWVKPAVTMLSADTPPLLNLKSATQTGQPITPEQAIDIAMAQFPDARFCHFHPPQGDDGAYEVAVRQPHEVQQSFGATQVWIDQYTGSILAIRDTNDYTGADAFFAWQFPLHNGEAFGLVGRWIVFFAGLTPAVLYITGFIVWWRKRRSRRRQRRGNATGLTRRELLRRNLVPSHSPDSRLQEVV
ncbi:MAG: PepSY-associated TM helix domain-containing protein [Pirellulales bacterium]